VFQTQQKVKYEQQKASYEQQKAAFEQLREMVMNMVTYSGTCVPNPFLPYNHQPPPPPPVKTSFNIFFET
jgi:hypothetical protein